MLYFHEYFTQWVEDYKKGAVRTVTYNKYLCTAKKLFELVPNLKMCDLDRRTYQNIINLYAENHAKQTVIDFHNHLKATILDALDEGIISQNPTRKITFKNGNSQKQQKKKYLSVDECDKLIKVLDFKSNWDFLILLCLKTGLRFSEALALSYDDFDFNNRTLCVNKTYDYKFTNTIRNETKTKSSNRVIVLDKKLIDTMKNLKTNGLLFEGEGRIFNSTVNKRLETLCKMAGVPLISMHGLRHSHACLLFYNGISVYSISKRLGHSNVTVTQNTYIHIINELESRDNEKITDCLSTL